MVSIGLIYLIVRPRKINRLTFLFGLVIFIILSVIGPYKFDEGSVIYWRGEPNYGREGYFNIIGLILSGFLVGIILLPPVILYTTVLVFLFRKANFTYYELIAYFNASTYGLCFIFKWPVGIIWLWHFLLFSKIYN